MRRGVRVAGLLVTAGASFGLAACASDDGRVLVQDSRRDPTPSTGAVPDKSGAPPLATTAPAAPTTTIERSIAPTAVPVAGTDVSVEMRDDHQSYGYVRLRLVTVDDVDFLEVDSTGVSPPPAAAFREVYFGNKLASRNSGLQSVVASRNRTNSDGEPIPVTVKFVTEDLSVLVSTSPVVVGGA
jgi:hypothetical protein